MDMVMDKTSMEEWLPETLTLASNTSSKDKGCWIHLFANQTCPENSLLWWMRATGCRRREYYGLPLDFFNYTVQRRRPVCTYTHPYEYTYVKPTLYEHLRRTEPADLEIHEVTTGTSLSGTSPTTENIASLNSGINPEKWEHPCQVEDLNLGG
jgi:hypothetical protein